MKTQAAVEITHPRPERGGQDHHGLAWRLPAGLIFGIAVPQLLLIIFGELPSFHQPQSSLGGGSAPGLDAGPVPDRRAAGAGRVRTGLCLHREAHLPVGMRTSDLRTQEAR